MTAHLEGVRWRRLLLALACVALLLLAHEAWQIPHAGDFGITGPQRFSGPIAVEPGSAAYRAGLRTGDIVDLRALGSGARYRWGYALTGQTLHVPLRTVHGIRIVDVVATPARVWPIPADGFWFFLAGGVWSALFAMLLAWRRSDSPQARTLALLLILQSVVGLYSMLTPWPVANVVLNELGGTAMCLVPTLLVVYATFFPVPRPNLRRALAYAAYAAGIVGVIWTSSETLGNWFGITLMPAWDLGSTEFGAISLLSFLCAALTAWQTRGVARVGIRWVVVSFCPMYVLSFVVWGLAGVGLYNEALRRGLDVSFFVATIGLWCALLNRRVLDLGFVLNRAAIFAGVSLVLVGAFVLVEWLLAGWLQTESHSTNLAVAAALALCLGLSMRFVHARVESVVDGVLFRKRREDEEAIRTLAREAPYVTQRGPLLARVSQTLSGHADASSVAMLLDDGAGAYGGVNENDPALVALRARHAVLALHAVPSAIEGELAYPMVARGRLIGALVLGVKRSGEAYAPDESAAIEQLAHSVAAALDVLASRDSQSAVLASTVASAVAAAIAPLGEKIDALARANGATAGPGAAV